MFYFLPLLAECVCVCMCVCVCVRLMKFGSRAHRGAWGASPGGPQPLPSPWSPRPGLPAAALRASEAARLRGCSESGLRVICSLGNVDHLTNYTSLSPPLPLPLPRSPLSFPECISGIDTQRHAHST